ncbi:MAG: DUF4445 domain-containing protein, partial [Candidatus Electrothrix sp. AR3]|nr:DUF4445 domain-containing protein [Candidatus Electrothrix sp. AR3]
MTDQKSKYRVTFLPADRKINVQQGSSLINAARKAGLHLNASCGGAGVCGKCRVLIEQGKVLEGISEKLSEKDITCGYRQACTAQVYEDVTVRIPEEAGRQKGGLGIDIPLRHHARMHIFDIEGLRQEGIFDPPVEKVCIELPKPSAQDNRADVTRLIQGLAEQQGKHCTLAGFTVLRKIRQALRQKKFLVTATLEIPVNAGSRDKLLNIQSGSWGHRNFALAFDIGTTTIYGVLIDLHTGKVLAKGSCYNPQMSYGEDVISRIIHAEKPEGLTLMHDLVIEAINRIITELLQKALPGVSQDPITKEEINSITLAGNTTMTHLLLELEPNNIRRSPY